MQTSGLQVIRRPGRSPSGHDRARDLRAQAPRAPLAWALLWAPATLLLCCAPILYVLAGLGEDTTQSSQAGAGAFPALIAAPLLLAAAVVVRRARALALIAYAAAVLEIGRRLGTAVTIVADAAWTGYWGAAFAGWIALAVVCLGRRAAAD